MANGPGKSKVTKRRVSPFTILLTVTAVLTVLAVALLIYQNFDPNKKDGAVILDERAGNYLFSLESGQSDSYYPFGTTRLLKVEQTKVELLNLSGSVEDSVVETFTSPQVFIQGDIAIVYDQGGTSYHTFGKNGLGFSGRVSDPIESVTLSRDGKIAMVLDRDETNGVLRVLNSDGSLMMEWVSLDSQNSGFIIMASFANDSSFIDVSLLNTNRAEPMSLVNRFSLEDSRVGERIAQYQMTGTSPILSIIDNGAKTAFIGERQITTVASGQIVQAASFAVIKSVSHSQNGLAILATDTVGGRDALYYLSDLAQANAGTPLNLGDEVLAPVSSGRYTAIADGELVWLLTDGKLKDARSFDLKSQVSAITVDDNGSILAVCRDEVRRIMP